MALMLYTNSDGPSQHALPCSLTWALSVCWHILQCPLILQADNVGPDQPAQMRRLIWACVFRKLHKGPFHALSIICASGDSDKPANASRLISVFAFGLKSAGYTQNTLRRLLRLLTCTGLSESLIRRYIFTGSAFIIHITHEQTVSSHVYFNPFMPMVSSSLRPLDGSTSSRGYLINFWIDCLQSRLYTYTKISLRLLSTWLPFTKELKPRVCTTGFWKFKIRASWLKANKKSVCKKRFYE